MKALLSVVALTLLTASCTKPYVAPPLGPSTSLNNQPPPTSNPSPVVTPLSVSLSIGRGDPHVGEPISFVASAGTALTHAEWSFGNGATASTGTGETVYAYPATGTFDVQVTVTARDGRTGSDHASVTVTRRPTTPAPSPTPAPQPDTSGYVVSLACTAKPAGTATPCNVNVNWNGARQPSDTVQAVHWDFGDGFVTDTLDPVASHVYAGAGSYTVFAMVNAMLPAPPAGPGGTDTKTANTAITIP